jgi:hypothetical protein
VGKQSRNKKPIIGPATVRTSSNRKVFDFRNTRFWAERGLIHTVDEKTGAYTSCSVREWLLRAQALSQQAWREKYPDEREQIVTLVENMIRVARQAKVQGDPHTRGGLEEARRRMPLRVMMPDISYNYRGEVRAAPAAGSPGKLILPGDPGYR